MCDELWGCVRTDFGFVGVRVGTGCFCTEGCGCGCVQGSFERWIICANGNQKYYRS
jgi:hypothetical protein